MSLPLPGPDGGPLGLANLQAFRDEPLDFLLNNRAAYGDRYRMDFGGAEIVVLCDPADIAEALGPQRGRLVKWGKARSPFERITPVNLVILEGEAWPPMRALGEAGVAAPGAGAQVGAHVALAEARGQAWAKAGVVDIGAETSRLHRAALCSSLLGFADIDVDEPALAEALDVLMSLFIDDARSPLHPPLWLPTKANRARKAARETIDAALAAAIKVRRAGAMGGDALSGLLQASAGRVSDADAAQLLLSFYIAGRETPARALSWALHNLAWSPATQDAVAAEVEAVTGGAPLEAGHLERLTFTRQVLLETLRMFPPAWSLVFREAVEAVELPGLTLPPGSVLYMSPWVVHRDPRFWPAPDTFDPGRFAPGWEERVKPGAWLPFGSPARACVGQRMVLSEGLAVIAALVRRWRFTPPAGESPVPPAGGFTLEPSRSLQLAVAAR